MAQNKHLTLDDRTEIRKGLDSGSFFRSIAADIGKAPSTVSREVCRNRIEKNTYASTGGSHNRCKSKRTCTITGLCPGMSAKCRNKKCSTCAKASCNQICENFEEYHCPMLDKPPYVCNGCSKKPRCNYRKMVYDHTKADEKASQLCSESRSGISMTEEELQEFDSIVSPRLKLGQSVNHIYATSSDEFCICQKTAYKLISAGLITARPIDLPRMVRMSPRRKSVERKVDRECRTGRTKDDYEAFMAEHPDTNIIEIDTVEGVKGKSCILTVLWKSCDFQIAVLREHNDSASVTAWFESLYGEIGREKFNQLFNGVIHTDNGTEFSNPKALEALGLKVFYCDPSAPGQKGSCERNHSEFRRICPKGTDFTPFDQSFFDLAFSHVNSYSRPKKLNNRTPYDVFSFLYGSIIDIGQILHISRIDAESVCLKPDLMRNWLNHREENHNDQI